MGAAPSWVRVPLPLPPPHILGSPVLLVVPSYMLTVFSRVIHPPEITNYVLQLFPWLSGSWCGKSCTRNCSLIACTETILPQGSSLWSTHTVSHNRLVTQWLHRFSFITLMDFSWLTNVVEKGKANKGKN